MAKKKNGIDKARDIAFSKVKRSPGMVTGTLS